MWLRTSVCSWTHTLASRGRELSTSEGAQWSQHTLYLTKGLAGLWRKSLKGQIEIVEIWLILKLYWILTEMSRIYISFWNTNGRVTHLSLSAFFKILHRHIWFDTLCNSNYATYTSLKRELPCDVKLCFLVHNLQADWKFCPRPDCQHVASDVASPSVWWECGLNWL